MGRPRNEPPSIEINVRLYLRPGRDDDLIAFFAKYPVGDGRRPGAVIAALRGSGLRAVEELADAEFDSLMDSLDMLGL